MPRPRDNSDNSNTLPPPELNPLLNPLLGEHLGRWAEVYFTSPPEKRAEAVMELLQELRAESLSGHIAVAPANVKEVSAQEQVPPPSTSEVQTATDGCRTCGFENPPNQRFCGMCGARLREESDTGHTPVDAQALEGSPEEARGAPLVDPVEHVVDDFPWREKFSLFRTETETRSGNEQGSWLFDYDLGQTPYRRYLGAGLIVLLFVLGYFAWRSMQRTSEGLQTVAPSAPAVREPATAPTSDATGSNAQPSGPGKDSGSERVVASARVNGPAGNDGTLKREPDTAVQTSGPDTGGIEGSQTPVVSESSAPELAMAQSYLNGTNGHQRDSAEAVGWLWKAVAKQNGEATLLLSDLYLKGDGVPKNCDQARVLLDAAASKGMKNAGERLRHLEAFGCQ